MAAVSHPWPDLGLPHLSSGKVREIYDAGGGRLLLVTSDRISAFDVVMEEPIHEKGRVLTAMTAFWSDELGDVAPTHLIATDPDDLPEPANHPSLAGRAMLCRRADMLPIECIVRGHLSGSAWKEYRSSGTVHGEPVPSGLQESDKLPEPVFTPSTKAEAGAHDENISFAAAADLVGREVAERARDISLELYRRGAARAAEHGIVIADTKFELGFADDELIVCDEILTPDSSRFWPAEGWSPGATPPSFDKQPLRDFLESTGWDKTPPPPPLPPEVVAATSDRYVEAYERVTGRSMAEWHGTPTP
ncbi:MAG: Phosphoribosylaminoimidazole-succinocarboxamide synthase [Acidimicrobiales bacterium]|nr:Phosphoribosylaminoimidazole-succinocarboxamide synthase [Acidimicrobiales bacterium]